MATLNEAEFREYVRFAFNDTDTSNYVQRERLSDRPGNLFDGTNKGFFLFNRRIVSVSIYDEHNTVLSSGTDYDVVPATGFISATLAWENPNVYADYYWRKLTDTELDIAIKMASGPGGFTVGAVDTSVSDYCVQYALSFCYISAASKASEYYVISAAGKQVSKSEQFNHYVQMHKQALDMAQSMRTDKFKDRGNRDTPFDAVSTPTWVRPWLGDSGM